MTQLKTKPTDKSVEEFLNSIRDAQKRNDCFIIMKQVTKTDPKMWGATIVGFGNFRYKYANGREADWFLIGFSPR